ncbi:MAG: hypothetical protein KAU62_16465, partial [Candidatus Heimdallarchaeota archaeon]|nr:hypothetical protein [Candidatus Heimdallarchaeota archaeon]
MILTEKKLEYFFHRIPISSRQASILRQVIHQLATIRARKERYSHPVQKHYAEVYNHFKSYFNLSKYS